MENTHVQDVAPSENLVTIEKTACSNAMSDSNAMSENSAIRQIEPAEDAPETLALCDASSWITLLPKLSISGVAKTLAFHCTVEKVQTGVLWVVLDQAYDTLYNEMNRQKIELALQQYFSTDLVLHMESGHVEVETPAMQHERWQHEQIQIARQSIYADVNVQSLIDSYGARINDNSIRPNDIE